MHDAWVPNALSGLEVGTYVRCAVLELPEGPVSSSSAAAAAKPGGPPRSSSGAEATAAAKTGSALLSLRPSRGGGGEVAGEWGHEGGCGCGCGCVGMGVGNGCSEGGREVAVPVSPG